MTKNILLITPPFSQLNTPYPATPCLKGFLKQRGFEVFQADLGIQLINKMFSRQGFEMLFAAAGSDPDHLSRNSLHILRNEAHYLSTVDAVMAFLHGRDTTLAPLLCTDHFLPRASRFSQLPDPEWSFGSIGVNDKARFLATLYIEDVGDLVRDAVTPHFGFSRYAEKLAMSAHSFAPLEHALRQPENILETWMLQLLEEHVRTCSPSVAGITIPFPGNLYSALRCGKWFKKLFPHIMVVAGGGFVNTELRELKEPKVFDYLDFLTLDDGELPFLNILRFLENGSGSSLTRTYLREEGKVTFRDNGEHDIPHADIGSPDYSGLPLDQYLSLIELANPMHRLWSDGRWNKLVLSHGCYWHQCSFCDTGLDYIRRCEPGSAVVLVDRIERVSSQTGQRGFHFVDEAAPPALLKELALELLRRKIVISWWVNIRFEQAFTPDLCRLLAASGCIAVTGGLETASDRLLKLMNKGITIRQAAQACSNFSQAGIMVHAYLMYGFPTQTVQETIDSLEVVRQFFGFGLIQSAFWHQFTATVHSDVGRNPGKYGCTIVAPPEGGFARNDVVHRDPTGCDHQSFAPGLKKAIYNFMQGIGMDFTVQEWFEFPVPRSSLRKNHLEQAIMSRPPSDGDRMGAKMLWLGNTPVCEDGGQFNKERRAKETGILFAFGTGDIRIKTAADTGRWLLKTIANSFPDKTALPSLEETKQDYEKTFSSPFGEFLESREWKLLRKKGLLLI